MTAPTEEQLLDAEEDARACLAAAAALESVERELARAHEGAEVHREVVRFLVAEVARLRGERDRALACEAAALGLVSEWRERVAQMRAAGEALIGATEALAERAADVGWIDKDQHVEAEINRARRALEGKP